MKFKRFQGSLLTCLAATLAITSAPASANDNDTDKHSDSKGTFSFTIENDLFASSRDGHYTSGAEFNYVSDTYVPGWFRSFASWMPFYSPNDQTRFSWSLGQQFFTPDDIQATALQVDDRPYAGWLYAELGLLTDHRSDSRHVDSLQIIVGIVGPDSGAESVQREVHERVGSDIAQGWDNQLDNEATFDISYDRQWMLPIIVNHVDIVPRAGFMLGSSQRFASTGVTLRIGSGLSSDFGPPLIGIMSSAGGYFKPDQPFFWYLFIGAQGRYVSHNIFLDGNTDGDSHSVDKKEWVGDAQAGLAMGWDSWRFTFTQIARSKEFKGQEQTDKFGSLSVSYRF